MSVLMRRPSTLITSLLGSAFVPSSSTVSPFTMTRPSRIIFSEARRDATPALDKIFCNLLSTISNLNPDPRSEIRNPRSEILVFHYVSPELRQPPDFRGRRRAVDFGVRDQSAEQAFDVGLALEMFGQQHRLDRGDHVVIHA